MFAATSVVACNRPDALLGGLAAGVTAANLERVQNALQRANLVLTVDVAVTGPIFDTIYTAFENHCERYNIQYVIANPPEAVKTPNTASWVLLGPQGRPEVLESPPIDCLFDPPNLRPEHVLIHRCFARRVLHPIIVSLSGDPEPEYGPSCTLLTDAPQLSVPRPIRSRIAMKRRWACGSQDVDEDVPPLFEGLDALAELLVLPRHCLMLPRLATQPSQVDFRSRLEPSRSRVTSVT
ncbi:hypothetical protein B0H14DRAFT_3598534 [Mycena olivaceomarginata]|nr:hypothetical protein B0H14DRAFT_3598534 [Mycena olivaceomarginata]